MWKPFHNPTRFTFSQRSLASEEAETSFLHSDSVKVLLTCPQSRLSTKGDREQEVPEVHNVPNSEFFFYYEDISTL